ncbi:uncharacterized protein LOC133180340 [Saccostrea echinata]|uniref:uncharacterized protein LOC133180340 n=1 Tax=Saccostrea echinata TaxID=191078 RepID=UPI002A810209|nr:uncharacterized protein LOC133180340 [Saccostrea echinata]
MARRLKRLDTHFIVRYLCDDELQVRNRVSFKCDGDSTISVGLEYDVQWGKPKEVDRAVVLFSGTEQQMREKIKDLLVPLPNPVAASSTPPSRSTSPPRLRSQPSSPTSPRSPTPPRSPSSAPSPKRRKTTANLTRSGKPKASLIADGSPPAEDSATSIPKTPVRQRPAPETQNSEPAQLESLTPIPTPASTTPVVRFRPYRTSTNDDDLVKALMREVKEMRQTLDVINKKLDASNRRGTASDLQLKTVLANTNILIDVVRKIPAASGVEFLQTSDPIADTMSDSSPGDVYQGVPEEYQLPDTVLRDMIKESRNAGNFAVNLTRKIFPELYGEGNLRMEYNWYGGGKLSKKELDPARKQVVRRYVCYFFPEFKPEDSWRERIVSKINESLRRNDKRLKKDSVNLVMPSVPESDLGCSDDVFTFND